MWSFSSNDLVSQLCGYGALGFAGNNTPQLKENSTQSWFGTKPTLR